MWTRRWYFHKKAFRKSLRDSTLHRFFGERTFHKRLWRTDRNAMAGGLALGLFVAFTPTIPFQMLLAGAGALFLKVNLPMAVLAVWVSNPLTAIPIYMSAWGLGRTMLGPESPLADIIEIFTPHGRPGRILLNSAYLWAGSMVYATIAAAAGHLLVRAAWQAIMRIIAARNNGFRPNPPLTLIIKTLALIALIAAGLALQHHGVIDAPAILHALREEGYQWLPFALVVLMILLFTFALPAAPLIALCGVFYHPFPATLLVLLGGVTGSLCAYAVARQLATTSLRRNRPRPRIIKRMQDGTSFSTLFALRICPGVPHGAINYTAGALQTPLHLFITSTIAGFLAKGIVYTSAAYRATQIQPDSDIWSFAVLWPLLALLCLSLAGILIERYLADRKSSASEAYDANVESV
jgi:uncharacterized protein